MSSAPRRTPRTAAAIALLALIGGCGGDDEFANRERAPAPIVLSASITPRDITVSPSRIGAGTIELIASNLTSRSQQITLRSEMLSAGTAPLEQRTGPINPGDTASLTADLVQGTYRVTTGAGRTPSATIRVGPTRSGASDGLLQP
ncbi:MAG: hypothetical protein Q8K79_04985 [Solirubrobacteraceae bacterium]|nr:hypothetical protein [Solirubrobacteraceae bacterium]